MLLCRLLSRFYELRVQANYVNSSCTSGPCYACVLGFQIYWTPIAWGILASIKVRDACDSMAWIDFDRFMKQIMNAHLTVSDGQTERTSIPPHSTLSRQHTFQCPYCFAHHGTGFDRVAKHLSKLAQISHKAEQLISAIGIDGPKETEAQTI